MLELRFSGWFQCRLATDPDPSDEPRGVSGWTFSLPGEPDLDRIIRTQPDDAVERLFGPTVGVSVRQVFEDGHEATRHVLRGASILLSSDPVFEGRNGIASEDTEEPIFPFHLVVEGGCVRLEREFRALATGEWRFEMSSGTEVNPQALSEAGIDDIDAYQAKRRADLESRLSQTSDPLETLQLRARLDHIDQRGFGPVPMFVGLRYRYLLEGPWLQVLDPEKRLGGAIDSGLWSFTAWLGCWDPDALCGFMTGQLALPLIRSTKG